MNKEHNVEENAVVGSVDCVCTPEVVQALNEVKAEEVPGPSRWC